MNPDHLATMQGLSAGADVSWQVVGSGSFLKHLPESGHLFADFSQFYVWRKRGKQGRAMPCFLLVLRAELAPERCENPQELGPTWLFRQLWSFAFLGALGIYKKSREGFLTRACSDRTGEWLLSAGGQG